MVCDTPLPERIVTLACLADFSSLGIASTSSTEKHQGSRGYASLKGQSIDSSNGAEGSPPPRSRRVPSAEIDRSAARDRSRSRRLPAYERRAQASPDHRRRK